MHVFADLICRVRRRQAFAVRLESDNNWGDALDPLGAVWPTPSRRQLLVFPGGTGLPFLLSKWPGLPGGYPGRFSIFSARR